MDLTYRAYFVGGRPQVTWAWDLVDRNLRFLAGIDSRYFDHIATSQAALLDTDSRHYAAAVLRVAYGQGIETLLALIAAAMQAPQCVVGWMLAYRTEELREVIDALLRGTPVRSDPSVAASSFGSFAASLLDAVELDQAERDWHSASLARLWSRWASEFLDERATSEYNSFKHGTRAGLGGFALSIGEETTYGVPAAPEAMVALGGSEFGSTFYCAENVDGKLHQYPRRTSRNWSPVSMAHGLNLLAMSIQMVVSHLRVLGGEPSDRCGFNLPSDEKSYDLPWQSSVGISFTNVDLVVHGEQIERFTKSQVLALLQAVAQASESAEA